MKKQWLFVILLSCLTSLQALAQEKTKINGAEFCKFATRMLDYCDKDLKDILGTKLDSGITDDSDHVADYKVTYTWAGALETSAQSSNYEGWSYTMKILDTKDLKEATKTYAMYDGWMKGCKNLKPDLVDTSSQFFMKECPEKIYIRKKDKVELSVSYPNSIRIRGFAYKPDGSYFLYINVYPERR